MQIIHRKLDAHIEEGDRPQVTLNAFDDPAARPSKEAIHEVLASTSPLWFEFIEYLADHYPPVTEEWAFPGQKYGWSLRLIHKKRRIIYMTPRREHFVEAVVLGDKAVAVANERGLPRALLDEINSARRYAEGRGVRLQVRSQEDLEVVKRLADIKVAN